jgi:virulence-associated protein VapD
MNTFASCARKFELDKLYPRIERPLEDFYAADVGKALHAGVQSWLFDFDEDKAVWEFTRAFPFDLEYQQTNDYRSYEAALSTLEQMMDRSRVGDYRLASIRNPAGEVVPAIEVPFEIRFRGIEIAPCERYPFGARFSVIGYADAIMQNLVTDAYRTMDIKTTRMRSGDLNAKFKFDMQQVPYGIVVDHVAQGNVESFEVLYLHAYIDLLNPQVRFESFRKSRDDIREWALNKVMQFQQIAQYASLDYFPRTESGCEFYSKPCRFLEPCQSRDRKAIMDWLTLGDNNFVVDSFKPWITADLDVEA